MTKDNFIHYKKVLDMYRGYNITETILNNLIKRGVVRARHELNGMFVEEQDVLLHVNWENQFAEEYFTDRQFWDFLGYEGSNDRVVFAKMFKNLINLSKQGYIKIKELDYHLVTMQNKKGYRQKTRFIRKKEVYDFLELYVNTFEAAKLLGISSDTYLTFRLEELKIEKIQFIYRREFTFYKTSQIKEYLNKKTQTKTEKARVKLESSDLLTKSDVMELLNINTFQYSKFLQENILCIYERHKKFVYFEKSGILKLLDQMRNLEKKYNEEYFTSKEILNIYGINVDSIKGELRKIDVPLILRGYSRYTYSKCLYLKKDIEKEIERRNDRFNYYIDMGALDITVFHRMDLLGVQFPEMCKKTQELWYKYLKMKSSYSYTNNENTRINQISKFLKATVTLCERLRERDLFCYSAKELNMLFFNDNTPIVVQRVLYTFISELDKLSYGNLNKSFNITNIRSPFKNQKGGNKEKGIYTKKEYVEFFEYINNIDLHKKRAIQALKKTSKQSSNVKKRNISKPYESVWLYLIIHLNNAWRHWDCTEIPRIDFKDTGIIDSIEWLEKNQISMRDAKRLVKKIQINVMKHSKTGEERWFFCSDELTLAFAYAVVLCEIRARMLNPVGTSLVDFGNKNRILYENMKKKFFKYMENRELKFSSLKMNRTLITMAFNIAKRGIDTAHELELTRFFRNHKSFETTNIYIHLTQADVEFLSKQIFTREYFGFIADSFADILFGKTDSIENRTKQINLVYSKLGKDHKLEGISNFFSYVLGSENAVEEILKSMNVQEVHKKYEKLLTGHLPSKIENVHCLIADEGCIYPNKIDCRGCTFAIYNFYALSAITEQILRGVTRLIDVSISSENRDVIERDLILIIRDLRLLKEAEAKFGECVYDFMDMKKDEFMSILEKLPALE
ncbi:hypothetical protein ACQVTX_17275 [Bacillus pretiosus]|uniref:hypothetical protein n=1 Tax=Bacillus pretiosus TaxID=2983392 RepID=UPI003D6537F0